VSNASDDFPDPDKPVTTTNLLRGIATSMFFRLLTLAPFMMMYSFGSKEFNSLFDIYSEIACKGSEIEVVEKGMEGK